MGLNRSDASGELDANGLLAAACCLPLPACLRGFARGPAVPGLVAAVLDTLVLCFVCVRAAYRCEMCACRLLVQSQELTSKERESFIRIR